MMWQTKDVREIIGVNTNTFNTWLSRKAVVPTVPAEGTGTRAEYSFQKIVEIAIFNSARKLSISLGVAEGIASLVVKYGRKYGFYYVVTLSGEEQEYFGAREHFSDIPIGQTLVVFDTEAIRDEVSERMVELNLA